MYAYTISLFYALFALCTIYCPFPVTPEILFIPAHTQAIALDCLVENQQTPAPLVDPSHGLCSGACIYNEVDFIQRKYMNMMLFEWVLESCLAQP